MNRSIKFRAWDKKDKVVRDVVGMSFYHDAVSVDIEYGKYLQDDAKRFELMQYTGLKDKNGGGEVFAGDIVNIHIFVLGVNPDTLGAYEDEQEFINVEIQHGNPFDEDIGVETFYFEYDDEIILLATLPLHEESVEVIGNIHEDPHLLERD